MANKLLQALNVSQHTTNIVFGNFSYVMFLGFLAIVYIANAHFAEKGVRRIQLLQKEIKELKLSGQERADLVTFLESLTGEMPPNSGPPESK